MAQQPEAHDLKIEQEKASPEGGESHAQKAQEAAAAAEVASALTSDREPVRDVDDPRVEEAYQFERTRPISPEEQQTLGELRSKLEELKSAGELSPEERQAKFDALHHQIGDAWRAGDKALANAMRQRLGIAEGQGGIQWGKDGEKTIYGPLSFIDETPSSFTLEMNKLEMDAVKLEKGTSGMPFYNDASLIDHYMEINPGQRMFARAPQSEQGV